jgi:hypothetical protein
LVGANGYYHLFHTPGAPMSILGLVPMVSVSGLGIAIGLWLRARRRRPIASLSISAEWVQLVDRGGRVVSSAPKMELPVAEGWFWQVESQGEAGGFRQKGHNAYVLVLDLAGRWAIHSPHVEHVVEEGFAVGAQTRPNVLVTPLDYLRLRRLLLPERAAKLETHMQRQEDFLHQHGIEDRHPIL